MRYMHRGCRARGKDRASEQREWSFSNVFLSEKTKLYAKCVIVSDFLCNSFLILKGRYVLLGSRGVCF